MNINRDIGMVGFFGVLITICFLVGRFNFSFNGIIGGVQRTLEIMEKTGSNCMIPANRVTPESIDYLLKNYPITSGVPFKNLQSRINKVEERNK